MTMMKRAASIVLALACSVLTTGALPIQVTVPQRGTECLYEIAKKDEHLTLSVFVTSGSELKATTVLEGPVAPPDVGSGRELQAAIDKFQTGTRYGQVTHIMEVADFEHLQVQVPNDDEDDEDDDALIAKDADLSERERQKKKAREAQKKAEKERAKEAAAMKRRKKMRDDGEPLQQTVQARSPGWYRACVKGTWYQITAEMDLRKASELGGLDEESGHVLTWEQRELMDEEDTFSKIEEEGVKDEDFDTSKAQLNKLRRLLSEIQSKQQQERHRLLVHAATNEHSHSRMVLRSLLETVLFMAVTGFQVYTIRKWFSDKPLLVR